MPVTRSFSRKPQKHKTRGKKSIESERKILPTAPKSPQHHRGKAPTAAQEPRGARLRRIQPWDGTTAPSHPLPRSSRVCQPASSVGGGGVAASSTPVAAPALLHTTSAVSWAARLCPFSDLTSEPGSRASSCLINPTLSLSRRRRRPVVTDECARHAALRTGRCPARRTGS